MEEKLSVKAKLTYRKMDFFPVLIINCLDIVPIQKCSYFLQFWTDPAEITQKCCLNGAD